MISNNFGHILHCFGDTAAKVESRQFVYLHVPQLFPPPSFGVTSFEFRDEPDICKKKKIACERWFVAGIEVAFLDY